MKMRWNASKKVRNEEKFLTSRLEDVTKQPHGLPVSVLYTQKRLKVDGLSKLQGILKNYIYICGTSFSD